MYLIYIEVLLFQTSSPGIESRESGVALRERVPVLDSYKYINNNLMINLYYCKMFSYLIKLQIENIHQNLGKHLEYQVYAFGDFYFYHELCDSRFEHVV